jgi:hypothetical protein
MSPTRRSLVLLALGLSLVSETPTAQAQNVHAAASTAILDGRWVLRQSPEDLQALLGPPERTTAVAPDDFQLPAGGTLRVYRDRGMRIEVDFERERSTTVMIEFSNPEAAPRTYESALQAINLPDGRRPDLITRDTREWHDLRGYFVRVVAAYPSLDHIDGLIMSVYPFP